MLSMQVDALGFMVEKLSPKYKKAVGRIFKDLGVVGQNPSDLERNFLEQVSFQDIFYIMISGKDSLNRIMEYLCLYLLN